MSRNVCVLTQSEAESLFHGATLDCSQHPHIKKSRADAMARTAPPTARWVGKNRVVRLPGQRTWRVEKIEGGFKQWQFVP